MFGNECFQQIMRGYVQITEKPLARTEDCLYLNVYKPVTNSSYLLPVMVWIHGGAFFLGAGSQYEGSDLAANGVILVTINYRLDVFGYLANEDNVIPGNYGMLDQVMALKWVKGNIRTFGGDPDKVTIFGESAGSSSVSMLVLSPLASGLFSRAIMESGTSLSPWTINFPASRISPKQVASLIGGAVGCSDQDTVQKLDCLRTVDATTLFNASVAVQAALGIGMALYPVVETTFGFLPDSPVQLWEQDKFNHVDTIRGFNKAEPGFQVLVMFNNSYSITKQDFAVGVKDELRQFAIVDIDQVVKDSYQEYNVEDQADGHDILLKLVGAISDIAFRGPSLIEANIMSKMAPEKKHYVYEFDHKPALSRVPPWMPAIHGEELQFVFGVQLKQFQVEGKTPSFSDLLVSSQMQKWWTNFAKYGTPTTAGATTEWKTYDAEKAKGLKIDAVSQEVSFRNSTAMSVFSGVLRRLDSRVSDAIVG